MSQLLQYYKSLHTPKNNKAAPTFEDLSIDDNLSELERVVKYCKSSIGLQRLVHVKMLADVAKSVGFEATREHIIPVLESLSIDFEPVVRSHFCEQLSIMAQFCNDKGGDSGYQVILDIILPIIAQLLEDDKIDVRHAASAALVHIAQIIRPVDLGQYVLTIILQLAHEDDSEEKRMTASELLNLLAEHLGLDLCKQFVIPEVVSLAEDPVFRVRKSTALNFQNVCKVGGEYELFERLMPAFVRLSKDDMYRVRRACAESLCEISKHVSDDIRAGVLVEIFLRLAQDPSKLVKQSVLQQSGMFIATLPSRVINRVILDHYCSMVNNPTGDMAVDSELRHYCAFSFPGVLQTVGAEKWPLLRQVYHTLVQTPTIKVKQTLALSLHEVARVLGTKLAEEELVSVFEEMIQEGEVVRMGVIKYLGEFLRLLSMPCRVSYLPLLDSIIQSTSPFNWRLRQCLAFQLPALVILPPPQNVFSTLFPLAMTLLQDPVAEVRIEAFKGVAQLLMVLRPGYLPTYTELETGERPRSVSAADGSQYMNNVARAINALTFGETYQHRQIWAELSLELLRTIPQDVFEQYFIDGVLRLTVDPVPNVRVGIAEMLAGWDPSHPPWSTESSSGPSSPWTWFLARHDIQECVKRLAHDDNDIYIQMIKLQPMFPEIDFQRINVRGMKRPPGGLAPIGPEKTEEEAMREYEARKPESRRNSESHRTSENPSLTSAEIAEISGIHHTLTLDSSALPPPPSSVEMKLDAEDERSGEDAEVCGIMSPTGEQVKVKTHVRHVSLSPPLNDLDPPPWFDSPLDQDNNDEDYEELQGLGDSTAAGQLPAAEESAFTSSENDQQDGEAISIAVPVPECDVLEESKGLSESYEGGGEAEDVVRNTSS